ncbi:MAG: hypothetical protein JSV19_04475 [Phycisphaerales bacterium]|nr:MAG: hypothetical protein JSV19_04475 [Phycisphaerales bacterium]
MDVLRRHLFLIICGLVGVAGIAAGAVAITVMSKVQTGMEKAVRLHGRLSSHTRSPVNKEMIDAEQKRIEAITGHHENVIALADGVARHEQLVDGFFPAPDYDARFEFPKAYSAALDELYLRLKAGTIPTESEVRDAEERIEDERRAAESVDFGVDEDEARRDGEDESPGEGDMERGNRSGLITAEQAKQDPYVRASIAKAKRIYCYATLPLDPDVSSFDVIEAVYDPGGRPPRIEDCWDAQLSLWIQQDVVEALASVNERAAEQLEEQDRWVGNLPVKDLVSLRVTPRYVGTQEGPLPEAFTGNTSGEDYEVIYFTLNVVVDARDLPSVIEAICNNRFTTLYRVNYKAEPANLEMAGRIYGGEPVVDVMLDFETILFSKLYLPIMPDIILGEIGKQRPEPEEAD